MALDLFQELGAARPPPVDGGRDLLREFGVSAQPARGDSEPSGDRDLFAELGVKVDPGLLERAKSVVVDAGRFVAGAVKQTGEDIANFVGSQPSVMKDKGRDLLAEFGLVDTAPRADPRDVAVGQRVVQGIVDEGRRRDIGTMKPEDRVTDAPFRKPLAPVRPEGVLPRVAKDVASGVTSLGAGFAGAAEWMTGAPSTTAAAKYLEAVTQNLTPDDPNFGDQLAAGAGSFAGFFLPGLGVAKGAQAIGKVNTVLANWLGAGASAGLEAAAEAGSVYRQLRQEGKTPEEASRAATGVFWSNVALVGVTNKLGLFSETGGAIRRGATSAAMEGSQEYGQQIISNVATGQPATEGAGTAGAIGAILGGGAGAMMGARPRPAPALDISDAQIIDQRTRTPVETSVTAGEPASATAPIVQPPVVPAQPAVPPQPTMRPPSGSAVAPAPPSMMAEGPGVPAATTTGADLFERLGVPPPITEQGAVDRAAHEAATSPRNALPEPTDAQQEAGNYAKGHVRIGGLDISIENPIGSERSGTDPNGEPWSVTMAAHYGYVRRTEGKDGDQVDVYVAKGTPQDWTGPAFVVDQVNPATGRFDEHKAILGASTREEAARLYDAHFSDASGPQRRAAITQMPMQEFKQWLKDGNLKAPVADLDAAMRNAPSASIARAEPIAGNMPRAIAQAPASAQPRSPGSASETGATPPMTEATIAAQAARDAAESVKEAAIEIKAAAETMRESLAATAAASRAYERGGEATDIEAATRTTLASPPIDKPGTDLAATTVPSRTYAPSAATPGQVDTDQARPDQIREAIRTLFNVPINERGVTVRRAAGIYKVKPQAIRVRNQNDLDVIAHEVGHHFSETKPRVRGLMKTHEAELLAITPDAYAKEPKALRREEGFAEFVRLYLTQKAEAQRLAPGFLKDFDTFINDNPHYRAAFDQVRGMVDEWFGLNPVERIMAKVGGRPKSLTERLSETFGKDRLIFEALDNWQPLKLMVADLKPGIAASADPFKAAHLLSGDAAVIEDWLVNGSVPFDYAKRADPANYGKPLHDILKPVAKELRAFSVYLIAKRAQELKGRGKENLFTAEEINAGLTLETPGFKAAAEEVYAYNDRLLDYAVEGGLLSQEAADKFREYTAYIPFFREAEDGAGGGQRGSVFRRLLGGTENLRDPISNIIQNTANIVHATNRNAVLAKAYQLAQSVPGGGRWIEAIPMPKKAVQVTTERILEQLKKEGVAIDTTLAEDLAAMQTFFQPNTLGDDRHRITVVKIGGEPKALQVNNKMLWQALQAFEPVDLGLVASMLAVPSDLLRAGVTLSPEFMARNFMRDTLSGFIQSKPGMVPLVGTVGGFKEVATRSDAYKLYRAFGGAYGDLWKGESEQTRKILERMAKRGKFDPRTILTPSGIIDVLHRLGSVSEAGTRVAEFKKTARQGGIDNLIDAAYNAREVSVDFGMHGHNKTVRLLTRITPFLNPAMQGFYKMGRVGREQFFTTLLRGSMLTAFSVALYLMNRDEDWYDDIEQWEKDVYWHFDVGLREDGKVIPLRLPKPFEWGAVFGSIPEALTQVATDLEGSKFGKRLVSIWNNVFAIRAVPTVALVPAELWANKNTFTHRPIVPESKEKLDPELQFTPGTSLTAREVGEATGTSPAQIDHLVRGFLGTMGVYSVMLADQALRLAGDYPEPPASSWRQMPVIKAFVHDPDNPNSRHVNEFYELLNKARRAEASHKKYEGEAANAYYDKHSALIDIAGEANRAARDIAGLRKDNEDITGSRDYTGQEKRRLINENNAMIKEIAKGINVEAPR